MAGKGVPVGLITLGCAKNTVDSEYMLAELESAGFTPIEDLSQAHAIVVNTCAFIGPAREESIETILEAARFKTRGSCRVLVVVGCLASRYRAKLESELPEVDVFLGLGEEQRGLGVALAARLGLAPPGERGVQAPRRAALTAAEGWAYLKISEGCDNRCSYCAIPLIRGNLQSRPEAEILQEARYLESLGVKELNLIAQDVAAYGADRGGDRGLVGLMEKLLKETQIPWLRLLYIHPAHLGRELLELMAAEPRILPYLDLPVQHASDRMLERMGRKVTASQILDRIGLARALLKRPVLRTTVLVGFPGEGKKDFAELLRFIEEVRFDRLGGFLYSREENTPSAGMRDRVPRPEKERRLAEVLDIQRGISAELNAARVGSTMPVLIERRVEAAERPEPHLAWLGRSPAHAPEVDGSVFVAEKPGEKLAPGRMARVRITVSGDYDLYGEAETV